MERRSQQYQGDGQASPSRIKLLYKKTESGTLLKVGLVGAILMIRQVKLGREATSAIHGNRLIFAECREMNRARNSVIHTIDHRWAECKERGNG